jgi:hypothetical protein
MPPSDDVIPPLAQVHLLGRGPGPLFFQSGRLGCGGALSAMIGHLLCKCGLRFFPLHTSPVVHCVVSPAATSLGLFPRGRATTGQVGASTIDASGYETTVAGSTCFALGLLGPRTISLTLADRSVQ